MGSWLPGLYGSFAQGEIPPLRAWPPGKKTLPSKAQAWANPRVLLNWEKKKPLHGGPQQPLKPGQPSLAV